MNVFKASNKKRKTGHTTTPLVASQNENLYLTLAKSITNQSEQNANNSNHLTSSTSSTTSTTTTSNAIPTTSTTAHVQNQQTNQTNSNSSIVDQSQQNHTNNQNNNNINNNNNNNNNTSTFSTYIHDFIAENNRSSNGSPVSFIGSNLSQEPHPEEAKNLDLSNVSRSSSTVGLPSGSQTTNNGTRDVEVPSPDVNSSDVEELVNLNLESKQEEVQSTTTLQPGVQSATTQSTPTQSTPTQSTPTSHISVQSTTNQSATDHLNEQLSAPIFPILLQPAQNDHKDLDSENHENQSHFFLNGST